ncbi:MAG TPA: hypothetical protein VJ962_02820 [Clostridia bacterium]|nr:hypothetical protein [Clostridia bacterium]
MEFKISMKWVVALILGYVKSFLKKIAQELWDNIWIEIFGAIAEAEKKWKENPDFIDDKRQYVKDYIFDYISEKKKLNFIEKQALNIFLNVVIDSIVATINEGLGKDWVEKIKELEDQLDDKIPFVD